MEALSRDLETKGYSVVSGVVTTEECDIYTQQFKDWVAKFGDDLPFSHDSLMHYYRVGHFDATWRVRLKAKRVFASLWNTEKLLSSMDGIAIGVPPEIAKGKYREDGKSWLHLDQGRTRKGLHVYQAAVYLEETSESDHCLRVLGNSHLYHDKFQEAFPDAMVLDDEENEEEFFLFKPEWVDWYKEQGCTERIIAVPKGGMVIWDSRTVHDAVFPKRGRVHSDRWRFVVFVCMAPAIWATDADYKTKQFAYDNYRSTAHWPAQKNIVFRSTTGNPYTRDLKHIYAVETMPDVAKTRDAKLLAGLERYDFNDGAPNDPGWRPTWDKSSVFSPRYSGTDTF
ncbi:uncharacterized protein LOC110448233 isoform X2 [Mizuhopecten yessoensis]|uniref:uncharacterized protein LOC110448233 isoform X2 n=1 Tax=Mizuhopecten yessoensis TaxID=6573 RepID=UPI000B45BDF8|nr:uncharacterized protein LOC110448233 isoform X2 [Mizuhopecten yessoensis]